MNLPSSFISFDDINAIVLIADKNGEIVFANKAVRDTLGYEPEEVLGDGWWNLTFNKLSKEQRKRVAVGMATGKIELQERHLFENELLTKDGRIVWTQWTNTKTKDGFLVGIAQDISEKKILQKELESKNLENELLLKEIHHRIKNNLQVISSLLNLYFGRFSDAHVADSLASIKEHISSMALLHSELYRREGSMMVNFSDYIEVITESIANTYSLDRDVKCIIYQEELELEIGLATNLGLIITEFLTNSYKYAFQDKEDGIICIKMAKKSDDSYELKFEDNGIGVNNKEFLESPLTTGLQIVLALVEQINGSIGVSSKSGVKYKITFKI